MTFERTICNCVDNLYALCCLSVCMHKTGVHTKCHALCTILHIIQSIDLHIILYIERDTAVFKNDANRDVCVMLKTNVLYDI